MDVCGLFDEIQKVIPNLVVVSLCDEVRPLVVKNSAANWLIKTSKW